MLSCDSIFFSSSFVWRRKKINMGYNAPMFAQFLSLFVLIFAQKDFKLNWDKIVMHACNIWCMHEDLLALIQMAVHACNYWCIHAIVDACMKLLMHGCNFERTYAAFDAFMQLFVHVCSFQCIKVVLS